MQKDEFDTRRGLKEISVDRDRMNKCKIDHVTCTRKRDDARLIEKQREAMAAPWFHAYDGRVGENETANSDS